MATRRAARAARALRLCLALAACIIGAAGRAVPGDQGGGSAAAAADTAAVTPPARSATLATAAAQAAAVQYGQHAGRQAYASLLYGDEFLTGLRVLGQSLRDTGTERDLVALCTRDVSEAAARALEADGWRVRRVDRVDNPGTWTQPAAQRFPARFHGVYTKLLLWSLTEYERVVYLDADTLVVRNADELFACDGLCGVLRHSERINTGVLVLTPSAPLFAAMMGAVASTPSYTGGDQGFIASFFADFPAAPLFDPRQGQLLSESSDWRTATPAAQGMALGRLPTLYNADLGLFVANSGRWSVAPAEIRVLHYTLAQFKPWDWWSGWIMGGMSAQWQAVRRRLPPRGGKASEPAAVAALALLPLLAAALLVQRLLWRQGLGAFVRGQGSRALHAVRHPVEVVGPSDSKASPRASPRAGSPVQSGELQHALQDLAGSSDALVSAPAWLTAAAAAAGVASVLVALGSVAVLIPRQVTPALGWALAYELSSLGFLLLFAAFLQLCYRHGWGSRARAAPALGGGRGRPWGPTLALLATILGSLGMLPWWAACLRIQSFVSKVLLTASLGAVTAIVCTQCFIALAARWWSCGAAEAAALRLSSKLAA